MKRIYPDYLPQFRCLAGDCPDTCCKDWQIILDPATLARYRALGGALGRDVRAALVTEDGQTRFRLTDGHCPLLTEDGLCRIQRALGEAALCTTCRCHPRFTEEYGQTREVSLSLSCPAAASLILGSETPVTLVTETDDAPVTEYNELDPALYLALVSIRAQLFSILREDALPINERLGLMLLLCARAQRLLDEKRYGCIDPLLRRFSSPRRRTRALARIRRLLRRPADFFPCWLILKNMEHLTQEFDALLDTYRADAPACGGLSPVQEENLAFYFIFRHILKAVNDAKLLARMESCVFHVLSIRTLCLSAGDETARRRIAALYSKEVEHSDDNCAMLLRLLGRGTPRLGRLISMLASGRNSSQLFRPAHVQS